MQCSCTGNARFAGFARNVYAHTEFRAQSSSLDKRGDPTQLDRLEADATCRLALVMPPDVVERMNALVGADRSVRRCRHFGHAGKIVRCNGLLEKVESGSLHCTHIIQSLFG